MTIMTIIAGLFWLNVAALVYTYIGYPSVLFIIARARPRRRFDRAESNICLLYTSDAADE